jgi:hydrogenase maturation protease
LFKMKSKFLLKDVDNKLKREEIVLVLGVGNVLLKDEGVGVHVIKELQRRVLPDRVRLVDAGTSGLDILLTDGPIDKLVVVDALRAGGKPGTIYKVRINDEQRDELIRFFEGGKAAKVSLHQVGLIEALSIAEQMQCAPGEIVIVGVEPGEINYGLELTESVKYKMPEVINTVLEEI